MAPWGKVTVKIRATNQHTNADALPTSEKLGASMPLLSSQRNVLANTHNYLATTAATTGAPTAASTASAATAAKRLGLRHVLPLARVLGAQRPNFFHKFRYFPPKFRETFGEI